MRLTSTENPLEPQCAEIAESDCHDEKPDGEADIAVADGEVDGAVQGGVVDEDEDDGGEGGGEERDEARSDTDEQAAEQAEVADGNAEQSACTGGSRGRGSVRRGSERHTGRIAFYDGWWDKDGGGY